MFESVVKPEDPQTDRGLKPKETWFESVVKPEDPQTDARMWSSRSVFESVVKPEDPQTGGYAYTPDTSFESVVKPEDPQTRQSSLLKLDFHNSSMTCRGSILFVDFQGVPGTIVLGFFDGSRALAGMGS